MSQSTGYVVFAHGSRLEAANDSVRMIASELAKAGNLELVGIAFLDCTPPTLETAVGQLVRRGATEIVVVPYFLTMGRHAAEDLPRISAEASRIHKEVVIHIAAAMDGHPALAEVLLQRAREAHLARD